MGLSRFARGVLVIASKACCGPIPLRWAYGGLRGIGPALAEEALRRIGFRAVREGFLVFASEARCGPIPLRWHWLVLSRPGQSLQGAAMDGIIWTAEFEERR